MPGRLGQVPTPGVHTMLADQVGPAGFTPFGLQIGFDLRSQSGNILGVLEDGDPAAGLVRGDPFKSLEHFEARDSNPSDGCEVVRKKCSPNAVGVENRSGTVPSR